jgi:putative transposase
MPRRIRFAEPTYFHVLNRALRREKLFEKRSDYVAFMNVLAQSLAKVPVPLLAYCVMPNHFHLVIGPTENAITSMFMHRLTMIHSKRWHQHHGTAGTGPVYQGRFKAFPVGSEQHFLTVCRYVELNPLRAGLVQRAEHWPWSSLGQRCRNCDPIPIAKWPILQPSSWTA